MATGHASRALLSLGCGALSMVSVVNIRRNQRIDDLAQRLNKKLCEWSPEIAEQVRRQVDEIIELADQGLFKIVRSRTVEQEVLDLLDEPTTR